MYDKSLWDGVLTCLAKSMDAKLIDAWLKPAKITANRGDNVTIVVPNKFYKDWIDKNYLGLIGNVLKDDFGIDADITVTYDNNAPQALPSKEPIPEPVKDNFSPLDSKLTFDNFVSGESNGFAHSAALAVGKGNFSLYNPLYIYGGTGLGKTHLMFAIANQVRQNFPKLNILYMDAETFTTEVLRIFRNGERDQMQNRVDDMRERFRSVDLFMLDDIQFLKTRERTLEFFFNIFNELQFHQKQVVITSDESPKEINMAERMRSRFTSGFQAEIQPPGIEERVAILMQKAEELSISLDNHLAIWLSENVATSNVRELIGALKRVSLYASFHKAPMSIELAEKTLADTGQLRKQGTTVITPQQIISMVSETYNVKLSDLVSKKRTQSIVHPRQIAMYLIRQKLNLSYKEIGNHLGGRDHSTVKYAVDSIAEQIKQDEHLSNILAKIMAKVF
jgi:chromosomal replication initiator protein